MVRLQRAVGVLKAGVAVPAATVACSVAATSLMIGVALLVRPRSTRDIAAGFGLLLIVTFVWTLMAGLPIAFSLRQRGRFNVTTMTSAGAAAGAGPGALIALVMHDAGSAWPALAAVVAWTTAAGALGAWSFERVCRMFEGAARN
jgi:hypothetical protein